MSKRTNFAMRKGAGVLFAVCFGLCLMPMGCAATDEYTVVASPQTDVTPVEQEFPEDIAAKLKSCAKADGSSFAEHSYDVTFEVQLDEVKAITDVKPNGSRLDDAKMEMCMMTALKELPIEFILRRQGSGPATSQIVSPASRRLLGNVAALPQLIRLAPIILTAPGGVTIVVCVVIVVAAVAVVGSMSQECVKEWKSAKDKCADLLEENDPPQGVTGGFVDTKQCARGLVSQRCGGNRVDDGGLIAQPGRKT